MTVNVTKPQINVREKLSELDKPSGIAGEAILRSETPQEVFNYINAGRRNLFINGAMQVAQRGTSFTGLTSGPTYTLDRWLFDGTHNATITIEQSSDAPEGFGSSLKLTATTADTSPTGTQWCGLTQRFEGQDIQQFNFATPNAKQLTVSFWIKASTTGTGVFAFYQDDGNVYYGQQYSINSSNTWEYKTLTVSLRTTGTVIPNDNTRALRMYFGLMAGPDTQSGSTKTWGNISNWFVGQDNFIGTTNATFQITGVQLEVGSVATPFEHRSYGEELALCQRYFETSRYPWEENIACAYLSGYLRGQKVSFLVEKRTSPTVTVFDEADGTSSKIQVYQGGYGVKNGNATNVGSVGFSTDVSTGSYTTAEAYPIKYYWTADAEL